jgi:L-ascorbate metabolism protein UlaG (beta-lactamase superfamily)
MRELSAAGIHKVDAVLVGHAHHDHALDATAIADLFGARVIGSESFAQIYCGSHVEGSKSKLEVIPRDGGDVTFPEKVRPAGKYDTFKVRFVPSKHNAEDSLPQWPIKGEIRKRLKLPAYWTRMNMGAVFALRIEHPEGNIVVTTTAGAVQGALAKHGSADVLFLGVGYLSKEGPDAQQDYWDYTVLETTPDVIVPTHWDDFTRKLSRGLKPPPLIGGNTRTAMTFVKNRADHRKVRVLDVREKVYLKGGNVYIPPVSATSGRPTS